MSNREAKRNIYEYVWEGVTDSAKKRQEKRCVSYVSMRDYRAGL